MNQTNAMVVTRFAPSPTGELHVGGARTALFSWAFARGHGGRFIVRFEDTDQARSSTQSTRNILRDLTWLGIDWDEGPIYDPTGEKDPYDPANQRGEHGPYFQSQRLDIYRQYVQQLLDRGLAYRDGEAVRFRMDRDIAFEDQVFGPISVAAADLEDFVILKADGFPTFHLAVVVDDALMKVTHVIRGQEHLSNTPKHVALQDALGFPRPVYAHTPSIMNPDGSKMSKRDKARTARAAAKDKTLPIDAAPPEIREEIADFLDKKNDSMAVTQWIAKVLDLKLPEIDVADFRESGYLPQVLCNYVALLGWNPGNNIEKFDNTFLAQHFGLERVGKANARFDRDKLLAFNADAIANLPVEEFATLWIEHMKRRGGSPFLAKFDEATLRALAAVYQPRSRTLNDPEVLGAFFVADDESLAYDPKAVQKVLHKNEKAGIAVLGELRERLAGCEPWDGPTIHALLESFAKETGRGMGDVAQPLRVAVSGSTVSPPIQDTLAILGRNATLARIERCIRVNG